MTPSRLQSSWYLRISLVLIGCAATDVALAQSPLPANHFKYRITQKVFQSIERTFGQYKGNLSFQIIARSSRKKKFVIAQYVPPSNGNGGMITIDEEMYDLCRKLGPDSLNALASVIGHELVHHYRHHDWYEKYGLSSKSGDLSVEDRESKETEADFYGCFHAHLAGYNPDRAFPLILDSIYQKFNISDNLHGYAPREFRKSTYDKKSKELHQLVALFRAGLFLYAAKSFNQAAKCYERIARDFPSEEMLNNQAACLLQDHIKSRNIKTQKFIFPIEFDVKTRLKKGSTIRGKEELNGIIEILREALRLNPGYVPARVNLACTQVLNENYPAAIGEIESIGTPLPASAYTIRAIAYYHDEQFNKAASDFNQAKKLKAYGANYNLAVFEELNGLSWVAIADGILNGLSNKCSELLKKWMPESSQPARKTKETFESSGRITLSEVNYKRSDENIKLDNDALSVQYNGKNVYALAFRLGVKMLINTPEYRGQTTKGIQNGSSQARLQSLYGLPAYSLPLTDGGSMWIYRASINQTLTFVLLNGKVNYWAFCSVE